jgi:translation elongation factor EF-1beta
MHELQQVKTTMDDQVSAHLRSALSNMAFGLKNLSIGVRASYMLLEEVQKDLRHRP